MNRFITIVLMLLSSMSISADNQQLLEQLDNMIARQKELDSKKQQKIGFLPEQMKDQLDSKELLKVYSELYEEYYVFNFDSAFYYVDKGLALAYKSQNSYYRDYFIIQKTQLLSIGGLYSESIDNMSKINPALLDAKLHFRYYITYFRTYQYWSDYCNDHLYSPKYKDAAMIYLKKAIAVLKKDDEFYHYFMGEYFIFIKHDDKKAMECYLKAMKELSPESRVYAMSSFAVANNYSAHGNKEKYKEYMIKACISDLLCGTKENLALQDLAMYLFKQDKKNMERANVYIRVAMEDAKGYNSRLRILEVSNKLPLIVSTYQMMVTKQVIMMRFALAVISVLVLAMLFLLYFVFRQNKLLTSRRKELSHSNGMLKSLNEKLNGLNKQLLDTNSRREGLAKIYIDLCAKYIDKLSKFELFVKRKIKANQVNELLSTTSSSKLSEDDAATFLHRFDRAFLDLYPSFVSEFNLLLKENEQIEITISNMLTTELRIFALIRLGIKESSEIAALLFYTPRTIYNYRSAIKNKAKNRDTFEEDVAKLCTVIKLDQ